MIKNLKEIIIFFLIVAALGSAAWCFLWRKANVEKRLLYEDTLFRETVLMKKTQEQLLRMQSIVDDLQKIIDNLMFKFDLLESELFSSRQELEHAKRDLAKLKTQNISARRDIERANSNINNLKNKIANIVKESLNTDERLMLLMKTKDALSQQLEQYREKISHQVPAIQHEQYLYKPALEPITETILDEPLFASGEVLTVNREFAFLVINLGRSHGIEEEMILSIRRDDRNLGQARVETVRENISAAALIDKENLSQIRAGDKALVTGSM